MRKVILIADSGTTKTDWSVIIDGSHVDTVCTKGMNPYFQTFGEIKEEIEAVLIPKINASLCVSQINEISRTDDLSIT